jgi:hypothetical protein
LYWRIVESSFLVLHWTLLAWRNSATFPWHIDVLPSLFCDLPLALAYNSLFSTVNDQHHTSASRILFLPGGSCVPQVPQGHLSIFIDNSCCNMRYFN